MRRFRSILVVPLTDREDPPVALQQALALAGSSGADVTILAHRDEMPRLERELAHPEQLRLREAAELALAERLAGWAAALGVPELPIELVSGPLPEMVADRVRAQGHDLVVIAADDTGESATASQRILRTCPCPVWLLRHGFTGSHVLAAIDPDDDDGQNQLILELARSQAEQHEGELQVIHAWSVPNLDLDPEADHDRSRRSTLVTDLENAHRVPFEAAVRAAGIEGSAVHLVDGHPARAIRGLAQLYRADLVVLGAGAESDRTLGLGSVAEQVVNECEASILVVRGS